MPAAYLFDMDGLLLDTERLAQQSFLFVADRFGLCPDASAAFFLTLVGTAAAEGERLARAFLPGHLAFEQIDQAWRHHYREALKQGVPVKPTVRDTLARLQGQGARMAVVTSTKGDLARQKLHSAALNGYFEQVLGGDEVSANKPDPAPYREAAAALAVAPEHCAAFEDSDRGIAAAVAAGCLAVQVPDLRDPKTPVPQLGQLLAEDLAQAVARAQEQVGQRRPTWIAE